jgi:hypothetical protein
MSEWMYGSDGDGEADTVEINAFEDHDGAPDHSLSDVDGDGPGYDAARHDLDAINVWD